MDIVRHFNKKELVKKNNIFKHLRKDQSRIRYPNW